MHSNDGYVYRERVSREDAGSRVLAYHAARFPHSSLEEWRRSIEAGRVRVNRHGRPVVHYALSRYDQNHVRIALFAAARILQAAGAQEISTSQYRAA